LAGFCESGNEPSSSIKIVELLDELMTCWLRKEYSAPCG